MVFIIAFYFCVVSPFQTRNAKKMERIERLLTRLERYERKGHKIRNEKWIATEETKLEVIKTVQHKYEQFYKERDSHLEKFFVFSISLYAEVFTLYSPMSRHTIQ